MTTSVGAGRMTTAPPIPSRPPANRALRILLLACVAVAVIVGLVVAVNLLPSHHKTATATATATAPTPSADPSPMPSISTSTSSAIVATSGPVTTAPGDPQAALKAQIVSAYAHFLAVTNQVFDSTTLDVNTFNTVATGDEFVHLTELALQQRGHGYVSTGVTHVVSTSVVVAPAGTSATVTACLDLSGISTTNAKTGQVVGHEASGHQVEVVYMTAVPPAWKVSGGPPQPTAGSC